MSQDFYRKRLVEFTVIKQQEVLIIWITCGYDTGPPSNHPVQFSHKHYSSVV